MIKKIFFTFLITSLGYAQKENSVVIGQMVKKSTDSSETITFAVIGDFGKAGKKERDVADLIKGWGVDFIITTGDNNYPDGKASTIDKNIGRYYSEYIGNYKGSYGKGSDINRFFPVLGNHDWRARTTPKNQPYLDYFTLPGAASTNTSNTENYYDFINSDIHFFMLDTGDDDKKSGLGEIQEKWLRSTIPLSTTQWQIAVIHHAPFSSGIVHGSHKLLQLNYEDMGIDVVFTAHEHLYERIHRDDNADGVILPYFISGAGGKSLYEFRKQPIEGSQVRYADDYGSMLVKANADSIVFEFWNRKGVKIDQYTMLAERITLSQPVN